MKAWRRFTDHKPVGSPLVLAADHYAIREASTLFRARRSRASEQPRVFKSGRHSRKIGSHVTKGAWSGMPIYTLSLEERATCPRSCSHWRDCYGNKMNWSVRLQPGKDLKEAIEHELAAFSEKHPSGFVIRLHVLGDFYNVGYVLFWRLMLRLHAPLRVFGYTAWQPDTAIGRAVYETRREHLDRFAVRFSDGPSDYFRTGPDGIVCPAQTEKTDCCGTCGLCWSTPKPIAFMVH